MKLTSLIILISLFAGCGFATKGNETHIGMPSGRVNGLWFYVDRNDQYSEVYFGDTTYFFFQDDYSFTNSYHIDNEDSLHVHLSGEPEVYKIEFIDNGSFKATTKFGSTSYYRVEDTVFTAVDWDRIMFENNEDLIEKYRLWYFTRSDDYKQKSQIKR